MTIIRYSSYLVPGSTAVRSMQLRAVAFSCQHQ